MVRVNLQTEEDDDEDKMTLEEEIEEERQALIKAGMEKRDGTVYEIYHCWSVSSLNCDDVSFTQPSGKAVTPCTLENFLKWKEDKRKAKEAEV